MLFPNLIETQPRLADEIARIEGGGFLPQALLFSGERGSSRLTAALDLSFHIMEKENKREILSSGNIIFFPKRKLSAMITCSLELYGKQKTRNARLFMLESVRKALMQYNGAIQSAYDAKAKSLFADAAEIDQALLDFEDDREYSDKEISSLIDFLRRKLTPAFLSKGKKSMSVSIDEIRAVKEWLSETGDEKFVIFENIEDSTEGAKNSLLKLLEEPDPNSHLILISQQPQRLLPTILSRVRKFNFPELSEEKITALISKKFSLYSKYKSFESFFFREGHGDDVNNEMDKAIKSFSDALSGKRILSLEEEEAMISFLDKTEGYSYFREECSSMIEREFREGNMSAAKARRIYRIFSTWQNSSDIFNLSQRMAIDLALREASDVK